MSVAWLLRAVALLARAVLLCRAAVRPGTPAQPPTCGSLAATVLRRARSIPRADVGLAGGTAFGGYAHFVRAVRP